MKKRCCLLLGLLLLAMPVVSCRGNSGGTELPSTGATARQEDSVTEPGTEPGQKEEETSDMISHWTLDAIGQDGLIADESGRKNGMAQGAALSDDAIAGKSLLLQPSRGGCISFGTQITDALKQTGAVTVAFWYHPLSTLQGSDLFCLWMSDGKPGIVVELSASAVTVRCRSHAKESVRTRTFAMKSEREWTHLALSADFANGKVTLYRNGAQVTANETDALRFGRSRYEPGTPAYADTLGGFAGDSLNVRCFPGRMDEVYLFSKAATDAEIAALWQSGRSVIPSSVTDANLYAKLSILTSTGTTVLSEGSNVVLHNGRRCFLLPGDATAAVRRIDGRHYAPLAFYEIYRNRAFTAAEPADVVRTEENGDRWLAVEDFATLTGTPVRVTESGRILIGKQGSRADAALLDFIDRYYSGALELLPVPEIDMTDTRSEVIAGDTASTRISYGSPSLLKLADGSLLASFDYNGKGYKPVGSGTNDAGICRSVDGGATWMQIATVPRMLWGSLFRVEETVYLIGRDTATAKLAIVKSTDSGRTWTSAADGQIDRTVGSAHRAPTPVVFSGGRVYVACEDSCDAGGNAFGVQSKRAYMMSAEITADLTRAESWTKSKYVSFDPAWLGSGGFYGGSNTGLGFYEGNAVAGKNGTMYIILRMDTDPTYGKACLLRLGADNRELTFERILDLPVGKDKFAVRYDAVSGKYIAVGNRKTTDVYPLQRNVLAMYTSSDLVHWEYAATLLSDDVLIPQEDSVQNHGYQYPDFLIDGSDLLLVVREASGNTTYYHDANHITFYRVRNFRNLTEN